MEESDEIPRTRQDLFKLYEKVREVSNKNLMTMVKVKLYLEEHLKTHPNDIEIILRLAELYWLEYEDYEKAEEYFQRAYKTSPDDKTILEAVGYFYENKNDYSESIKYYEKLADISPESAKDWLSLARVQVMEVELSYKQYDIRYYYEEDVLSIFKNILEPGYRRGIQLAKKALNVAKDSEIKAVLWLLEILYAKSRDYGKAIEYKKRLEEI